METLPFRQFLHLEIKQRSNLIIGLNKNEIFSLAFLIFHSKSGKIKKLKFIIYYYYLLIYYLEI